MKIHDETSSALCHNAHWSSGPSLWATFGKSTSLQGNTWVASFPCFLHSLSSVFKVSVGISQALPSAVPEKLQLYPPTDSSFSSELQLLALRQALYPGWTAEIIPGGYLSCWLPLPCHHPLLEGAMLLVLSVPCCPAQGTLDTDIRRLMISAACGHPQLLPRSLAKLSWLLQLPR